MRAFALALHVRHLPENATMPGLATRGQKDNPCCRYRTGKLCKSWPAAMRGLCAKTLGSIGISGRGSMGAAAPWGQGSVVCDVVTHFTYVHILLCEMLCCRHVKLSKELVHNALLRCRMWLHRPRALPQVHSLVHTLVQCARRFSKNSSKSSYTNWDTQ